MSKLLAFLAVVPCLLPALALAQATRTWVSGVGDDANPGSRTAPCKTFAGAISKTAPGGIINVLDPGGFGAVTITKSITLDGGGAEGNILVSGTHGLTINAGPNDVVILRNLTFEGLGNSLSGVNIVSAGAVHIEHCRLNAFTASGIHLQASVTNAQLFVKDTTIHGCTPAGINLGAPAPTTALVERVNITGCLNGIIGAAGSRAVVTDTTASGNVGVGFLVGTNATMTLRRVTASDNQVGVQSAGIAVLSDATVVENAGEGLKRIGAGKILSTRNSVIYANGANGSPASVLGSK